MSRLKEFGESLVQHYQPIVGLHDLKATRFEALVRSADGSVSTPDLIADLESSGRIQLLDAWSLVSAIKASRSSGALISVNVSAQSICSSSFLGRVEIILKAARGAAIAFELTETQPVADMPSAKRFVDMAHANGCRIGLDDFGDGYSSLAAVEILNLDFLKLSSQLTIEIGHGGGAEEDIHYAVAIAKSRGMTVVGEHIETISQMDWLRDVGVDLGQGWLFSKAMPGIEMGRSYESVLCAPTHEFNRAIA